MSGRRCCACGCGRKKGLHRHHVVYQQRLRQVDAERFDTLRADPRNIVLLAFRCHGQHHARREVLPLRVLPDSVYEFAAEVLGYGPAFEYLRRHYAGDDPRLDALLDVVSQDVGHTDHDSPSFVRLT